MNVREEDIKLYLQQMARRWLRQELIGEDGAAAIVKAHPTGLRTKSFVIRAVQFVGVLLAIFAIIGWLATTFDTFDKEPGGMNLMVSLAAAALAYTLMRNGEYCAGIDEGCWGAVLLLTGLGLSQLTEIDSLQFFLGVTAVVALVPASLGYLLSALVAWAAASALLLDFSSDLRLLMLVQLGLTLFFHWIEPMIDWRRRLRQVAALRLASALAAFLAANRFVPELFVEADLDWGGLHPLSHGFALVAVPFLTGLFLWVGLRSRRRGLVDVGLIAAVVTALTLGHELSGVAMEIVMIVVGLALIVATLALRSYLQAEPAGFTSGTRDVAIPPGWSREDLQASEGWAKEILSGLNKDVRRAQRAGKPAQ